MIESKSCMVRGELVRPKTARSPQTARLLNDKERALHRKQFGAMRNSTETISTDDLCLLKLEKQKLIEERSHLKTKILKYESLAKQTRIPHEPKESNPVRNQQIIRSLDRQIRTLTQMNAKKQEELNKILFSDTAAKITEYQEESKVLYLELSRLHEEVRSTKEALSHADTKLKNLTKEYSNETLNTRSNQIAELEKQVRDMENKNRKLSEEVNIMEELRNDRNTDEVVEKLRTKIENYKNRIKEEQLNISSIEKEITDVRMCHAQEVQDIQGSII